MTQTLSVQEKYSKIKQDIVQAAARSGRDPADIKVIAVTKYVTVQRAKEALDAGITDLGENRDDGFAEKHREIGDAAVWHFIGTLQSRKVKNVIKDVDFIHSVDRLSLAREIEKRSDKPVNCFIQVNASGEESKHGLAPDDVIPFVDKLEAYPKIKIVGLMTMAPHTEDEEIIRQTFRKAKRLQEEIKEKGYPHAPCDELSMGMSNDYTIAVEEGSTYVRIGSALVGE